MDFADINETDEQFFILRHDVEFSVEKAYELAQFEHDSLGVKSSYFFQIRNYAYNPLAFKNISLIKKMYDMGHHIGLHVNTPGLPSFENTTEFILNDVSLLRAGLGLPVDRFSFHRPTTEQLESNIRIDGLINAYDTLFFHFYKNKQRDSVSVHYFSDSEHQWKYGDPLSVLKKPIKKIQLLIHPYSWSKQGLDNLNNFKALLTLKHSQMLQAMHEECRNFPKELLK